MNTIELTLPYPVSANRYWRHVVRKIRGRLQACVVVSPEALEYRNNVAWMCNQERVKPFLGDVAVEFMLYPNKGRCMDIDNAEKVALDALQSFAYRNDSQVGFLSIRRMKPDGKGGRLVVRISKFEDE